MANEVNHGRRRFLTITTAVVGAVGAAGAAVPFFNSWKPSARAQSAGAPVEVDISKLAPGEKLTAQWRGMPVWVFRRTPEQISVLASLDSRMADPNSENTDQTPAFAKNPARAIRSDVAVIVGVCTHLGCTPIYVPEMAPQAYDDQWKGGFFCPCHQSRFDLAGRVFSGVPAPSNLKIPPYHFINDNLIEIGVAPQGA